MPTGANRHSRDSPAMPGNQEKQQSKQMGLNVKVGGFQGQSWGQENQRAQEVTGETAEALPSLKEGEGRGRPREGRMRQGGIVKAKARCRGPGKTESGEVVLEWGTTEFRILEW